jgi:hypothetical protein
MAVASMGDVLFAEDDLRAAEQSYQQSLTMRGELGEKGGVANSHVSLAIVALENGQLAQAETLARDAAKEFETEKDADQRTAAEDVLAQSLIAQGNYDHAAKEIDLARKLGARDLPTTLSLTITRAKLLTKTAKSAEAERELQQVESRAGEKGLPGLEWQARLALADAQIANGNLASARANLQLVKRQAAVRGFGLLARKAAEAEASLRRRMSANPNRRQTYWQRSRLLGDYEKRQSLALLGGPRRIGGKGIWHCKRDGGLPRNGGKVWNVRAGRIVGAHRDRIGGAVANQYPKLFTFEGSNPTNFPIDTPRFAAVD